MSNPSQESTSNSQAEKTDSPLSTVPLTRHIEQLQQELMSAQRLSVLGELVGTTTHEFNNVLMTVINYARMGLRHPDEETRTKAFSRILAAAERANTIVNSVLGVARNRCHQFETTHLQELLESVMVLMERELRKYRIQPELDLQIVPPVRAIGNQIQQVIMNLMINARQAMPDGGRLVVRLSKADDSQWVDLMIRDFGTGIAADQLPQIFELGFSTKAGPDETGRGGSGIGLHACKQIIERHSGKIRVESQPGQGTAFTIRLPIAHQCSAIDSAPALPTTLPAQST